MSLFTSSNEQSNLFSSEVEKYTRVVSNPILLIGYSSQLQSTEKCHKSQAVVTSPMVENVLLIVSIIHCWMIRQGSKRVSRVACIKKDLVTMISIEGKGKHLLNDLLAFIMPSWKSSNEFPTLNLLLAFFQLKLMAGNSLSFSSWQLFIVIFTREPLWWNMVNVIKNE